MRAPHVTPLAAPLLLEVGRVPITAGGVERLLEESAEDLMRAAGTCPSGHRRRRRSPMTPEYRFRFRGSLFAALPEGALWWPERRLLCVADMHLGKGPDIWRGGQA